MSRSERCEFHTKVKVTNSNIADVKCILDVSGPSNVVVGDTATIDYSVNITYMGQVANCLEAMTRLKGSYVGDQKSTDVLIKRVFRAFDKAIS